jgi:MFS family permease
MYHRRNKDSSKTNMNVPLPNNGFQDEQSVTANAVDTMDMSEPLGFENNVSSNSDKKNGGGKDWMAQVAAGFTSLKNSPPELYKVYALKFLDSYSYFSFSIIFTLFLSDDFGYSDIEAGTIYGVWGAMITVYGFCTGFLVDNFGVSKSLKLGYGLSLLARCGIFFTTSRTILLLHLYGTLPLGSCLGIPVLMTGIRRYTHETNRGFAFGIFYVVMNVAALISGPVVDVLTIWYKGGSDDAAENTDDADGGDGGSDNNNNNNLWSLSSYRAIILSGIIANVLACCISLTVREIKVETPAKMRGRSVVVANETKDHESNGHPIERGEGRQASDGGVTVFRPKTGTPWKILGEIWKSPSFRRYLLVVLIMLNVRQIFRHLDATWPKYMIRGTNWKRV